MYEWQCSDPNMNFILRGLVATRPEQIIVETCSKSCTEQNATEQGIDEFVAVNDENSHVFQEEILEEANRIFLKNSKH